MIRITELALSLDHPNEALPKAVDKKLDVAETALHDILVFKRNYDARK